MGRGKGRGRGGGGRGPRVCEEEEEYLARLAGQDPRVGRMPSDSDEDDESDGEQIGQIDHDPVISRQRNSRGQNSNVGMLPPSDSEDEDSEDDDEEIMPHGAHQAEPARRRKDEPDEPDPAQVAKDMERLKLIKEKREKERQDRIAKEGWDRFAPISDTNKPPTGAGRPEDA